MKPFTVLPLILTLAAAGGAHAADKRFGLTVPPHDLSQPQRFPAPKPFKPTPQMFGAPPVYPAPGRTPSQFGRIQTPKPIGPTPSYIPKSCDDGSVYLPPGQIDTYGRKRRRGCY